MISRETINFREKVEDIYKSIKAMTEEEKEKHLVYEEEMMCDELKEYLKKILEG